MSERKPARTLVLTDAQLLQAIVHGCRKMGILSAHMPLERAALEKADNGVVLRLWEAETESAATPELGGMVGAAAAERAARAACEHCTSPDGQCPIHRALA